MGTGQSARTGTARSARVGTGQSVPTQPGTANSASQPATAPEQEEEEEEEEKAEAQQEEAAQPEQDPTPPPSSQPWMTLPELSASGSARLYAKVVRGVNGQLPPLPTPNEPESPRSAQGDEPDSPATATATATAATATATPQSALRRTPRDGKLRAEYERRCWPFCKDTNAMEREAARERRKISAAQREASPFGAGTSYGLNFGLGLSSQQPGQLAMPASRPSTGALLMVPTPSGVERRVIRDLKEPQPQEGAEVLVVHHHYMPQ